MDSVTSLLYGTMALQLITMLGSGLAIIHLWDKTNHHVKDMDVLAKDIQSLATSHEIARDRVSYLYDQVSRVETKVDVNDKLEAIQEAIEEATAKEDRDAS